MGNKAVSKEARRAAREVATAAQDEVIRRTKANVEDLAAFFDARGRADAVDVWLGEREQALREQAAQRRSAQRLQSGSALRAMRDRGETVRDIARMAGVSEKAVRELIRETEAVEPAAAAPQAPVGADAAAMSATISGTLVPHVVGAYGAQADGRAGAPVSARA
jgi:hypothetical protein